MALTFGPQARQQLDTMKRSFPEPLSPSADFRDERFEESNTANTLGEPFAVTGRSTFGKAELEVQFVPYANERAPQILVQDQIIPIHVSALRKGFMHCLALEGAEGQRLDIVEHVCSLIGMMRLQVDVVVKVLDQGPLPSRMIRKVLGVPVSWPSFRECNGEILDEIASHEMVSIPGTERPQMTVLEPIAMAFENGSVIGLEPGDKKLLRNGINYPHIEGVGKQLFEWHVDRQIYARLARSRPPAFNNRRYCAIKKRGSKDLPFFALNADNVVLVGQEGIENPRDRMIDSSGTNLEYFGHEVIDKMFPWVLLEMSLGMELLGAWTTYCVSHDQERQFLEAFMKQYQHLLRPVQARPQRPATNPLSPVQSVVEQQ